MTGESLRVTTRAGEKGLRMARGDPRIYVERIRASSAGRIPRHLKIHSARVVGFVRGRKVELGEQDLV